MNKEVKNNVIALSIFAIAMALLESAIVIYMRRIFSPDNVIFPAKILSSNMMNVESVRELATIVMIASVAYMIGKNTVQRFAAFLYVFGIWDILYYVWLKVFDAWPSSFSTWDLLFLVPVAWVGPVLAPITLSITMISLSIIIFKKRKPMKAKELSALIIGSLLILYTFLHDYARLVINKLPVESFVPVYYNWPLFLIGEALLIAAIVLYYRRA